VRGHRISKVPGTEIAASVVISTVLSISRERVKCRLTNLRRGILPVVDLQALTSKCG
jgi:hypothetical protein